MISHSSLVPSSNNTTLTSTISSSSISQPILQATAVSIQSKHMNGLDESKILSPPSTTLTPSSTPSTTPTYSSSSMNTSGFGQQQQSVVLGAAGNTANIIPSISSTNVNSVSIPTNNHISPFNNGMLNTAFYGDPNLMQLLSNIIQNNQNGYLTGMYPVNYGYGGSTLQLGTGVGTPYFGNYCIQSGIGVPFGSHFSMNHSTFGFTGEDFSEQLVSNRNIQGEAGSVSTLDSKKNQLTTPERTKGDINVVNLNDKKTELPAILENSIDEALNKKRRKETSIDSVNSLVETVATETNSTVDDVVGKQTKSENDEPANSTVEDNLLIQNFSRIKHENINKNKGITEINDSPTSNSVIGSCISSSLLSAIHEEELFMSSDRRTPFDKILRIHTSLVGSLSWTPPIDRDDVVLKPASSSSVAVETLNNSSTSVTKDNVDDSNAESNSKAVIQVRSSEDYNPFKQREYNSANVTCFSPRMLPDWQLNWLRDVTRSLSNVPKSPMTGIHFDRTKPAWAVSYYECETRKYYFFFIPDLSEYTIEITLAAAIGCRQNVVARGAHKRKKPGVLTFNLYSGQFEKSATDSINPSLSSSSTSLLKGSSSNINDSGIFESDIISFKKDTKEHNVRVSRSNCDNSTNKNKGNNVVLESSGLYNGSCNLTGLNNLANLAALGTVTAALSGSNSGQTSMPAPLHTTTSAKNTESPLGSPNSSSTSGQGIIGVNPLGGNIFDQNIGNIANSGNLIGLGVNFPFQFNGLPPLQNNNIASQIFLQHLQPSLLHPSTIKSQLILSGNAHPVSTSNAFSSHHFQIPQYRNLNNNPFVPEIINGGSGVLNVENGLSQQGTVNNCNSFVFDQSSNNSVSSPQTLSSVQVSATSTPTSTSASTPVSILSSKISPTSSSCNCVHSDGISDIDKTKTLDTLLEETSNVNQDKSS
ncbi:hypothetical protein FG386_000233 [Cryptosporidium ryanae]|uniref:uncharacterized protein n=1 Tax=Cryptosporidium ryanae TaxID=515981 RepID=UPI003519DA6A|nr:hypothetical protein FG386_000233 [Cryptosporidium ryanae]